MPTRRSATWSGLIGAAPELALKAVGLRKFGQEIIRTLGGRRIHPNFAVPGGVNKALQASERDSILAGVDASHRNRQGGREHHEGLGRKEHGRHQQVRRVPDRLLWLVNPENGLELYDGDIRLVDRDRQAA